MNHNNNAFRSAIKNALDAAIDRCGALGAMIDNDNGSPAVEAAHGAALKVIDALDAALVAVRKLDTALDALNA